jgi:hypothetical protein
MREVEMNERDGPGRSKPKKRPMRDITVATAIFVLFVALGILAAHRMAVRDSVAVSTPATASDPLIVPDTVQLPSDDTGAVP